MNDVPKKTPSIVKCPVTFSEPKETWPETTCNMFLQWPETLSSLCEQLDTMTVKEALERIKQFQSENPSWFDVSRFIPACILGNDAVLEALPRKEIRPIRILGWSVFYVLGIPSHVVTVTKMKISFKPDAFQRVDMIDMSWREACDRVCELIREKVKSDAFRKEVENARLTLNVFEAFSEPGISA